MDGFGEMIPVRAKKIGKTRIIMAGAGVAVLLFLGWQLHTAGSGGGGHHKGGPETDVPVETAVANRATVPSYLEGLGAVQAYYTVTINSRVDGQLVKVAFTEGQMVKAGDLLAQVDPRPYQAAYDLASATKDKDAAQLANAKHDLERYQVLAPQDFTSKQTLDTQKALVEQLEAQVKGDQASVDNAKTQLDYTRITSPIDGRTGIRLVDPGNNVHATDTTGIVVVTQIQPLVVLFTLPEEAIDTIRQAMGAGSVEVDALSRDDKTDLARGTVALIDNVIDQTTGTIKVKATFPNKDNKLWPGEFVNARVLVATAQNALTIPMTAVQSGTDGSFAYVVKADSTVEMRPITIGTQNGTLAVVSTGLKDGERIVTTNQFRLEPGTRIHDLTQDPAHNAAIVGKAPQ